MTQSNQPLRIFIGYDHRQPIALNVLQFSIFRRSSKPVTISPIVLPTLPMKRTGLTPFTYSRFLVPWMCDYQGWALFLDIDFLVLSDIADLFARADDRYAAMVSKNEKKFEWASMIFFNCGHPANRVLTPDYIDDPKRCISPHTMDWLSPDLVGDLPREWNHLVGYDAPRNDAKAVHYTQGMPIYEETTGSEYREQWLAEQKAANTTSPWQELMARSVHAGKTADGRVVAKLHPKAIAS
jgi:lipopolysaccharide biosynthesis glycosyltransferase